MRRGGKALVLALALGLGSSGAARAQEEDREDREEEASAPPAGAPGTYQGVAPGQGAKEGHRPHRGRTPTVTWLGFQPQPGGAARVFVQLDRELVHAQTIEDGAVVIALTGARVAHSNSRRFLDTRFFDTPVERISIETGHHRSPARSSGGRHKAKAPQRGGRGLELVIRFKHPAEARRLTASLSAAKDGYTYLMVDVPPAAEASKSQ
ncbi:MAG TPA: hypothetical protein VKB80_03575 [Kofleriaceae bacterium]|nr:hypothetical protein [Kofleriaceae bacterium]